jgi:hypothetical protein
MQIPIDDSGIFIEVSRNAQASALSLLEPLTRKPSQGPSFKLGNSVDSSGPSPRASGSPMCLPTSLSQTAPRRLRYQASGQTTAGLIPFGTQWQPHHKHSWYGLVRLQDLPSTNTVRASTLGLKVCKPH